MWTEIKALPYKVFLIKDLVNREEIEIGYFSTDDMVANFLPSHFKGSYSGSLKRDHGEGRHRDFQRGKTSRKGACSKK